MVLHSDLPPSGEVETKLFYNLSIDGDTTIISCMLLLQNTTNDTLYYPVSSASQKFDSFLIYQDAGSREYQIGEGYNSITLNYNSVEAVDSFKAIAPNQKLIIMFNDDIWINQKNLKKYQFQIDECLLSKEELPSKERLQAERRLTRSQVHCKTGSKNRFIYQITVSNKGSVSVHRL